MERKDLKEKLIILGISIGIFLPIRLLFSALITDNWLGSLGVMSLFAILMVFLIKKKKLGAIGQMFERQMRKTIGGRTGLYIIYIIAFVVFFLVYFGGTLYFIERGNTLYGEDKEIFYLAIIKEKGYSLDDFSAYEIIGPKIIEQNNSQNLQGLANIDYIFSIAYAVMNDMSNGWLSHFVIVMFAEQIELIGLLIFFRRTFKPLPQMQTN